MFGLPCRRRVKALGDPTMRRRLDDGAKSPDAGIIGALARWGRLNVIETFAPEIEAVRRQDGRRDRRETGKGDVRRAARHRRGRRPAHRPRAHHAALERRRVARSRRGVAR